MMMMHDDDDHRAGVEAEFTEREELLSNIVEEMEAFVAHSAAAKVKKEADEIKGRLMAEDAVKRLRDKKHKEIGMSSLIDILS